MRAGLLSVGIFLVALALTMPLQIETESGFADTKYFRLGFLLSGLVVAAGSLSGTAGVSLALCFLAVYPFYQIVALPTLNSKTAFIGTLTLGSVVSPLLAIGTRWAEKVPFLGTPTRKGFAVGFATGVVFMPIHALAQAITGGLLTAILSLILAPFGGIIFGVLFGLLGRFLRFAGRDLYRAILLGAVLSIWNITSPFGFVGFLVWLAESALFGYIWETASGFTWA
jgi:hypothetical protein